MPDLKAPTEEQVQGFDPSVINNTQYILKDLIQGDDSVFNGIENLDMNIIKYGLNLYYTNVPEDRYLYYESLLNSFKYSKNIR